MVNYNTYPTIWNQLSNTIKSSEMIATYRKKFKTYLFKTTFPPYIFGSSMLQ